MSSVVRGIRNSIRNPIRGVSVVVLLGVTTAFALSLLLANEAVKSKLEDLKSSGATTLTVQSAGQGSGPGSSGGGEPLTYDMYAQVKSLEHIADSGATLSINGMQRSERSAQPNPESGGSFTFTAPESEIDLESPIDAGTLGRRQFAQNNNTETQDIPEFKIPVQATGIAGNLDSSGKNYQLISGEWLAEDGEYQAVLGKELASHNDLKVGSTFTAYDKTFTVVGIYDGGSEFANAGVLMPLKTLQGLTEQTGEVSTIVVKVDSLENMESAKAAITTALGEDKVEVNSSAQSTEDAIASLESIQRISTAGVVIAIIAASVIVVMVMTMIVRERKREIATLKAIGASNITISGQFVAEAVTLTLCSVAIGLVLALASSNALTKVLISSNTTTSSDSTAEEGGNGFRRIIGGPAQTEQATAEDLLSDVRANIGTELLVQGFVVVILISVIGSAIPAYAIAKVRPAEVMRGE